MVDGAAGYLLEKSPAGSISAQTFDRIDLPVTIAEVSDMTLLNYVSSSAGRYPATMALIMAAVGFALGFLLSLAVAAQSLYVCTEIQ